MLMVLKQRIKTWEELQVSWCPKWTDIKGKHLLMNLEWEFIVFHVPNQDLLLHTCLAVGHLLTKKLMPTSAIISNRISLNRYNRWRHLWVLEYTLENTMFLHLIFLRLSEHPFFNCKKKENLQSKIFSF